MKVTGFNGREYNLNLSKYDVKANDTRKRSKHHIRARHLIKEVYHSYRLLEEVKLPGSTSTNKRSVLYLDFFILTYGRLLRYTGGNTTNTYHSFIEPKQTSCLQKLGMKTR